MKLIVNPLAEQDLAEAISWYEGQQQGLGDAFLLNVHETMERIREHPFEYPQVYRQLRRAFVKRFPYGVFFRLDPEQITVLAVYHARRHPRGWQKRHD